MQKNRYSAQELRHIGGWSKLLKNILKKPSKYKNKKCELNCFFRGRDQIISFDSTKELNRFLELRKNPDCGGSLQLQEKFLLVPKSDSERALYYVADFYYCLNGQWVVEDTKGFKTRSYINKRKLFKNKYPDILFIET